MSDELAEAESRGGAVPGRTRWPNMLGFYADRGGLRSGESDFGVWWTAENGRWPHYRVSVVKDTGDVYAIKTGEDESVELLGTVPSGDYESAYAILEGWTDVIHYPNSLQWVRDRLARR